jgi:Domain of unknown function (DUF4249)
VVDEIPDSELPDFVDKIVINASFDNINRMEIEVSNSAWAYTSDLPEIVDDADLILTSEAGDVPLTYNSSSRSYQASGPATIGETYTLIASRKNYQTIRASCTIPEKVSNKQVGFVEDGGVDVDGNKADKVFIRFQDPAGQNFYTIHFYYYSSSADLFIPFDFPLTDATLKSPATLKLLDGGYLLNDDLFSGQLKEFAVVPPRGLGSTNPGIKYLVELRSISEDYYKYQRTLQQYRDQQDTQNNGPFGSAVIVHSNILSGLGAFISSTLESDTLR